MLVAQSRQAWERKIPGKPSHGIWHTSVSFTSRSWIRVSQSSPHAASSAQGRGSFQDKPDTCSFHQRCPKKKLLNLLGFYQNLTDPGEETYPTPTSFQASTWGRGNQPLAHLKPSVASKDKEENWEILLKFTVRRCRLTERLRTERNNYKKLPFPPIPHHHVTNVLWHRFILYSTSGLDIGKKKSGILQGAKQSEEMEQASELDMTGMLELSDWEFKTTIIDMLSAPVIEVKWKSLSRVTFWDPMDYTVYGILQARILEWVAFPFSRGSSQTRDRSQVSHIAGGFFTSWATREAQWLK